MTTTEKVLLGVSAVSICASGFCCYMWLAYKEAVDILVAERNNYVRPTMSNNGAIDIKNGRHPVVEQMISNDMFISNDTLLDNHKNRISIINQFFNDFHQNPDVSKKQSG